MDRFLIIGFFAVPLVACKSDKTTSIPDRRTSADNYGYGWQSRLI